MSAELFLVVFGLVWIIAAVLQDLKRNEVDNWLNFSLITFALLYRIFYSLLSNEWSFLFQGLIGLGIFFVLGNIFYYSRLFAGGDAKLFIALGAVLPWSLILTENLRIYLWFLFLFLSAGAIYGFIFSFILVSKNKKKFIGEFKKSFLNNKKLIYFSLIIGILIMFFGLLINEFALIGLSLLIIIMPLVFLYARSVDESCMIKEVSVKKLREGDWLFENLVLSNNKKIKKDWQGLTLKQIKLIKKKYKGKKVLIRQGIPFTPVFLISYVVLIYFYFFNNIYF